MQFSFEPKACGINYLRGGKTCAGQRYLHSDAARDRPHGFKGRDLFRGLATSGGKERSDIWDNASGTDVKGPHGMDVPDPVSGQVRLNNRLEG